jgi:hypothetical protein
MKKLTSLLCALTIMLGANAFQIRHDAPARAMANDFDFVQAMYMGHADKYSTGDWYFRASDGDNLLAVFDINTGSDNKISGTYQVGQPYASTYYYGGKTYNLTAGMLEVKLLGDTLIDAVDENGQPTGQKMKLPLYEFKATNLKIEGQTTTFSMTARAAVLAYDYQYQKEGKDNWLIALKDEVGQGGSAVEISVTGFTGFADKTSSDNYWFVEGTGSDNYAFRIVVSATAVSGAFAAVVIDDETPGGLTYLKKSGSLVDIKSGFGTATLNGDMLDLDVYLAGSDNTMYHIATGDGSGSSDDPFAYEETSPFSGSFGETDFQLNTDYFASNKAVLLLARNTNRQYLDLIFFVNALDPTISIPAGVYNINSTEQPGTVQASEGEVEQGGELLLSQSFAGVLNAAGTSLEKVWFLTGGTVTVTNVDGKIRIVINATNSKGQAVTAELGAGVTALEDVMVDDAAAKTMENGQLVIIRNGVRYNAQGAVVE